MDSVRDFWIGFGLATVIFALVSVTAYNDFGMRIYTPYKLLTVKGNDIVDYRILPGDEPVSFESKEECQKYVQDMRNDYPSLISGPAFCVPRYTK